MSNTRKTPIHDRSEIPRFSNFAEEVAFWETHYLSAKFLRNARPVPMHVRAVLRRLPSEAPKSDPA